MGSWIENVVEQLIARLCRLLASKVSARVELELAATQAALLDEAATWRSERGEIGERIAQRLELAAERLGPEFIDPDCEAMDLLHGSASRMRSTASAKAESTAKRPRGRPKKTPEVESRIGSMAESDERDDRLMEETTHEK